MDTGHSKGYRRYLGWLAGLLLGGLLLVTSLNLVVDPYGVWRLVTLPGINTSKSERRDQNYLFKAADLIHRRPQVLLMGSSRAAFGLNPAHPAFTALGLGPVYNAALTGGHMHAQQQYLSYAIEHDPDLKLIVWGLDFFAFSESTRLAPTFREDRLAQGRLPWSDVAAVLGSLDALQASALTVLSNLRRPGYQPYYDNGQLTAMDMAEQVARKGMKARFDQSLKLYLNSPARLPTYKDSPAAWQALEQVLQLAEQHGVEVRLFVSPVHAAMLEAIRQRGRWGEYHAWLQRLSTLASYCDFALPVALTTEPIGDGVRNYWDVSHYRSAVGDRLIDCLFSEVARCNWGAPAQVTAENVVWHLAALDARMVAWEAGHPKDVAFVVARRR